MVRLARTVPRASAAPPCAEPCREMPHVILVVLPTMLWRLWMAKPGAGFIEMVEM